MHSYEVFTFIICLGALFSYVNHRYIKLPPTIGIMVLSLLFSIFLLSAAVLMPGRPAFLIDTLKSIDFDDLLMKGMLAFLLFAGSIHIDASSLKKELLPIIALSTAGIFISTFVVGTLLHWVFSLFHLDIAYLYCLLFAALISPTDPIAVLAILKRAGLPKTLELKIAGESLFNDGVAVVVFLTLLEVAKGGADQLSFTQVSMLFLREAGGGLLYGFALGYLSFMAIRSIDKYEVEVMITLATVMGGYMLAGILGVSGPLAMVVAGIILGNKSRTVAVSDVTRSYLGKFWELIDEILNAVLFLLLGFEMLVISADKTILIISFMTIGIVLFARWVSVLIPFYLLKYKIAFEDNAIAILTWGGLRGGLSVALALSLPDYMHRDVFVAITYIVVVFSIIVQGLTIGKLYQRLARKVKQS
jgi:monovalent cation:H+ antiporter, CPA1 family